MEKEYGDMLLALVAVALLCGTVIAHALITAWSDRHRPPPP